MDEKRRDMEVQILKKLFAPDTFVWRKEDNLEYLDITIKTQSEKVYRLNVMIPPDYPYSCPALYVVYPNPLRGRWDNIIAGHDHAMHTLYYTATGLELCHYEHNEWSPQHTLYRVVMKGRIWLECYEAHLRTGKSIDELSGGNWS